MFKNKSIKKVIGDEELGRMLISMQINDEKDYSCENIGPIREKENALIGSKPLITKRQKKNNDKTYI